MFAFVLMSVDDSVAVYFLVLMLVSVSVLMLAIFFAIGIVVSYCCRCLLLVKVFGIFLVLVFS